MARAKKSKPKSNRRTTTASRTAQPQPKRGGQAPSAGAPTQRPGVATAPAPGPASANNVPPGSAQAGKVPPGLAQAGKVPPGLAQAGKVPPGPAQAGKVPPGPAQAGKVPPGPAQAGKVPPGPAQAGKVPPGFDQGEQTKTGPAPGRSRDKTAEKPSAGAEAGKSPAETPDDVPAWAAKALEELLTVTYWLDPGEEGDPFSATIRFSGRRTGVTGKAQPRDSFWHEEIVEGIVPGSGPVAVTAEVRGINSGDWTVTARPVARVGRSPYRAYQPSGNGQAGVARVPWPRRVEIRTDPETQVHTASLLRSKVPGVIRFAYATLVGLGVLVGLGLEALLLSHGHYPLFRPMLFSVVAIVAGVIGGKAWYIAVHRGKKFDGWCIQGFVAGAAVVVVAAAIAGPGIPAGAFLAAAAPALLIGMAIGRCGCFWAGCCTGRPVAARWGIWSSDRRLGCRRAPAQLLEALTALVCGLVVLAVVLALGLARSGPVALVGLAAYTLCRQFILGLRAEPRVWQYGRRVTAAVAVVALIVGAVLLARG